MALPVIVNAVVPRLLRVTILAEVVTPIATVPKLKLAGRSLTVVPIPVSDTVCGLPLALSVTLNDAVRVPEAVGLKVTLKVQLAPAASEVPHVVVCV